MSDLAGIRAELAGMRAALGVQSEGLASLVREAKTKGEILGIMVER
jgi:hypothetical protein